MIQRVGAHALWIAAAITVLLPSAVDPDLWGHVLFGRVLLHGALPLTNGLSYTAASYPWINHELAAEAVMAATFDALGSRGLVILKLALGFATLVCLWHHARRCSGDATAAAIATALAAVVMAPGFMVRPQLFTFAFLAVTLFVLAENGWRAEGSSWVLPLLVIAWTNTHGGVLAGIALALAAIFATTVMRAWRRETTVREIARAAAFAAALGAALLVNPYGVALPRFLLTEVTPQVPITEWAAVVWRDASFVPFKATLILITLWVVLARRASAAETVVVALAGAGACLHRRHIPLFAIAAAPLVAAMLVDLADRIRARIDVAPARRLVPFAIAAAAALQLGFATFIGVRTGARVEVDPAVYPVQALRFLAQNGIAGNVALPFSWGEYGLWALPAGSKVAVDGRFTTSYPAPFLEDVWRFMSGARGGDALLTAYPTEIVVADRHQAPAYILRNDPEWEYVYSDPLAIIFIRHVPSQADALARFEAKQLQYDRSPLPTEFPAAAQTTAASATLVAAWSGS